MFRSPKSGGTISEAGRFNARRSTESRATAAFLRVPRASNADDRWLADCKPRGTIMRNLLSVVALGVLGAVACSSSSEPESAPVSEPTAGSLALNLKTVFFATQFAVRHMQAGGRIVNLSSISGRSGRADQAHYAAAKCAVISVTQSAALSFASHGITVNAICPGVVETPMTSGIHQIRAGALGITPEESLARMVARIPLGHPAKTDDIAKVVSFLCSPDAAYITGQSLNVCGGMEMN